MEHIFELLLKNGLRPLSLLPDMDGVELHASRSEIAVLLLLSFRGATPMSELSEELGAPFSTMTSITKRLVQKRFIERRKSPHDQRIILVQLTTHGHELVVRIREHMERVFTRVKVAFTVEELDQFLLLAMKLGRALQQERVEVTSKPESDIMLRNINIDD